MSLLAVLGLAMAGLGAGLLGSTAGLASLASYPALLAFGLPPVLANVTNTTAIMTFTIGSLASTRPELGGTWSRLWPRIGVFLVFGATGAWLLVHSPPGSFESVVPWLIAGASILLMARDRVQGWAISSGRKLHSAGPAFWIVLAAIAVYGGYFGAAAGVVLLAWLMLTTDDGLAYSAAEKNVLLGASNFAATMGFVLISHIHWGAAACVAVGGIIGSYLGPKLVRRTPERPLRIVIGILGLGLAVKLYLDSLG
ncbi:sulfite exporter TauE/SafE family protein [Cumulibacter manganitolerans]|uniref:sulfite exporter TauE/SafE family protein n=1 Tax=Cumulibacter manganitolerans TaxID=1884992 RepID=UPI001296A4A7|nr:sulfite exporter TauE/SafE family protein [Cumulibacter manganitolerans]